jgi:hypothetical protein
VCSLSDVSGCRDGVLYPLRVVAEESGAAHYGFGGAMLDLVEPRDGEVAGGADFHFSDIPVRGDDGARAANDGAAAVEQRGRRRQHP